MSNGKPASKALFEDRKLQRELQGGGERAARRRPTPCASRPSAAPSRRSGAARCCCSPSPGVLALALSEGLRSKVLDLLFGAEEEFDYSSTTAPVEPAPAARPRLRRESAPDGGDDRG